ncbi:hypothetical protein [Fluviicola sp.]|uniref:hypothetical protein n=1 Tax=Fluviicola sp. TaxID=1917219 RepID=UPI003D2E0908
MGVQTAQESQAISQSEKKFASEVTTGGLNTSQFQDNRPNTSLIRKMQESANGSIQAKQTAQLQEITQGNSSPTVQLKTEITHKTRPFTYPHLGNNVTEPVGAEMKAYLDPTDIVVGSATGAPQLDLLHSVQAVGHTMVRGHLLNHDLGGFGVEENLYPITQGANNRHKTNVENPVGDALNTAHGAANNEGVYYTVKVNPIQNTSAGLMANTSTFVCEAYQLTNMNANSVGTKGNLILKANIESTPGGANSSNAVDKSGAGLIAGVPKVITPGWGHGHRAGRELNWDAYVAAGKINTIEGWSTTKQVLVGLGIGTATILGLAGYFYYNPDKMPGFLSNLMSVGAIAVEELKNEL